jgi:hypothetical protein
MYEMHVRHTLTSYLLNRRQSQRHRPSTSRPHEQIGHLLAGGVQPSVEAMTVRDMIRYQTTNTTFPTLLLSLLVTTLTPERIG